MRGFRFRAQAALDLRRREDDEAKGELARAQAALRDAEAALRDATARAQEARTRCADLAREVGSLDRLVWYRSWILRLDHECTGAAAVVAERQKEQARAAAERARTHQRVEALDRFKEKSLQAFRDREAAEEQKHLDSLATIRFVTAKRA